MNILKCDTPVTTGSITFKKNDGTERKCHMFKKHWFQKSIHLIIYRYYKFIYIIFIKL
jgi:hypothetical protein